MRALDGLRGWAALCVVLFHFTWEPFGIRYPEFRDLIFSTLFDGRLAVALFLGISGFVLTVGGWGEPDKRAIRAQLKKRYFRLMIPIAAASAIVALIMALGLNRNHEASDVLTRADWLGAFLKFDPDLGSLFSYVVARAFIMPRFPDYHPFLWTMVYELWGSLIVLLICLFERRIGSAYAVLVLLCVVGLGLDSFAPCFFLGALLALLYKDGRIPRGKHWPIPLALCCIGLAGTLCFLGIVNSLISVAAAGLLVAVLANESLRAALESTVSQTLGRISFPLFLMQFPVLITFTSWATVEADRLQFLNVWSAGAIAVSSVGLSLLAAWAFLPVERLTMKVCSWIAGGRRAAVPAPALLSDAPARN